MLTSEQGPETCNTYNMLRLTKMLYQTSADVHYMDYYERALYNHILSTIDPVQGASYISRRCVRGITGCIPNHRRAFGVA